MAINKEEAISKLIGSAGDIPLAVDRYNKGRAQEERTSEYDFLDAVTDSPDLTTKLMTKYRALLVVKQYELLNALQTDLMGSIELLRPSEKARLYSSLAQTFGNITAPATKITFDFDKEVANIASELSLDIEEVERDVKKMMEQAK